MHIVIVSQCEKKAILRTAKVLDGYAVRHGDRTWITPITKNGLDALYQELRSRGTRQTAVSCYANDGARRLKLLWVVGRKGAFGPGGSVAVATKTQGGQTPDLVLSPAMRLACLLAECAGLIHDFGKYGWIFQRKLESSVPLADPVRHEWISLTVLLKLLEGGSWEDGWESSLRMKDYLNHPHGIQNGLQTVESVLAFLVMSHHRLPRKQRDSRGKLTGSLPGDGEYIRPEAATENRPNPCVAKPSALAFNRIAHLLGRIRAFELPNPNADTLRAISSLARMALILADHAVSGVDKSQAQGHGASLSAVPGAAYANTQKRDGKSHKNQELGWHLSSVGSEAGAMPQRMLAFKPPGLSHEAIDGLRQRASDRYEWQNVCADALEASQQIERLPTLVMNIAGTGCGKTRMNMRAIAALRPPSSQGDQEPIRVATAPNLRTLTLQTRDAYAEQMKLDKSQLACVLGSRIAIRLHNAGKQNAELLDEDENEPEDDYSIEGSTAEPPAWLKGFMEKKPVLRQLLMAPVLVSTIDFLINAGEPQKQGNHALAMLRVMHSDLVLDEIDAYDPNAMIAVSRLVTAAAMWGRHVVASSATLSLPVARVLYDAFALGMRLRDALNGSATQWRQVVIDDRGAPTVMTAMSRALFIAGFDAHIQKMMAAMGPQHYRPAELEPVDRTGGPVQGKKNFLTAIVRACKRMHLRHAWTVPVNPEGHTGKLSIGLVRVANIAAAINVARHLADLIPNVRVVCYHSQVGLLQRYNIERSLDAILTRKHVDWQSSTVAHPCIAQALTRSSAQSRGTGDAGRAASNLSMIVVATPVEEIGRDHDFDWAVIEPSSAQSIAQTVGRVNRHRLEIIESPNVCILQYNLRECTRQSEGPVFVRPGLESSDSTLYGEHDLATLLNWPALAQAGQIDARVRYETSTHPFAEADDKSLSDKVETPMKRFLKSDSYAWLLKDTYVDTPLRESNANTHQEWFISEDGLSFRQEPNGRIAKDFKARQREFSSKVDRHSNDWLVLSFDETKALAASPGITIPFKQASLVQVRSYGDEDETLVHRDYSFGYWTQRNKA
ncbi:MAG: hypothetical protein H7255_13740 [Ramlibacter sp.]|nr:hypothetical protein [Ramlibacter sp.]